MLKVRAMKTTQTNDGNAAPQGDLIPVAELRLSQDQAAEMARAAAAKAATVMSPAEWEALRKSRATPISADAEMLFGHPKDFIGGKK